MIITIEGNIGAGKTTFAKALYERLKEIGHRVKYMPEPVDSWTNFQGTNLLDLMYSDRERWSFMFQVNALLHCIQGEETALKHVKNGYIVVRERSSFSVRKIFAPLLFTYMSEAEKLILKKLCNTIKDPCNADQCSSCRSSDITVYMRTDPEICYERVKKRNRPEELQNNRVDLEYLKRLHKIHEEEMALVRLDPGHRFVVADGNTFNIEKAAVSVKIFGREDSVLDFVDKKKTDL